VGAQRSDRRQRECSFNPSSLLLWLSCYIPPVGNIMIYSSSCIPLVRIIMIYSSRGYEDGRLS
jgi:hypothetical protein